MNTKLGKTLAVFMIAALIFSSFAVIVSSTESEGLGICNKSEVKQTSEELAWPSRQHDSKNTGRSPYDTTHVDGTEKWNVTFGHDYLYSPVIGENGTIYVGSENGNLYAVNPDGSLKWIFDTRGEINATPEIGSDGTIYVTSTPDKLFAINPDGTEEWSMELGKDNKLLGVGGDDTIYVKHSVKLVNNASIKENFTAINPDGSIKWNYSAKSIAADSLAIAEDGTIYMVSAEQKKDDVYINTYLIALNQDGTEKWNTSIDIGDSFGVVIGNDGDVYVTGFYRLGLDTSRLLAFNSNGTRKWNMTLEYAAVSPAVGSNGLLYVGCSPTEISPTGRSIYAIYPNGTVKWHNNYGGGGQIIYAPLSIGGEGTIYIASKSKSLFAMYPNGTAKWEFKTKTWELANDGIYLTTPAIGSDGTIYVTGYRRHGTKDSTIYAIGGTPSKPQNVQISSDDREIDLSWSSPSENGGSEITRYRIYRGNKSENLTLIDEVKADTTSYTDMDLEDGQTYYYQVSAFSDVGEGDRSEILNITLDDKTDPNADAGDDKTISINEEVTFDANGSSDNIGIAAYKWTISFNFTNEDGYPWPEDHWSGKLWGGEFTGKSFTFNFTNVGSYKVTLNVTDYSGNQDTDTIIVEVVDKKKPVAVAGTDKIVRLDEEVVFNGSDSSDNGYIEKYMWAIEENEYSGEEVVHSFSEVGTYDVTLTVTDTAGNSDSDTIKITVEDDVHPTVSVDIYGNLVAGEEITLDASESSDNVGISSIEWEFGDGSTATGANVTHTYDNAGDYTINVTVTDEAGNIDTDTVTIKVEKKNGYKIPAFTIFTVILGISLVLIYIYKRKQS